MYLKPPLPTDNMYKFLSFFGLTLIIISGVVYYQHHQTELKMIELEAEEKMINVFKDIINSDLGASRQRERSLNILPDKVEYQQGDVVQLEALPAEGYIFSRWSNGDLEVEQGGSGVKTEQSIPDDTEGPKGVVVEPNSIPSVQYNSVRLSHGSVGSDHALTVTMDRSQTIRSVFTLYNDLLQNLKLWDGPLTEDQHKQIVNNYIQFLSDHAVYLSKEEIINKELTFMRNLIKTIWIIFSVGVFCSVIGFFLWYRKLQRYQDLIIQQQAGSI